MNYADFTIKAGVVAGAAGFLVLGSGLIPPNRLFLIGGKEIDPVLKGRIEETANRMGISPRLSIISVQSNEPKSDVAAYGMDYSSSHPSLVIQHRPRFFDCARELAVIRANSLFALGMIPAAMLAVGFSKMSVVNKVIGLTLGFIGFNAYGAISFKKFDILACNYCSADEIAERIHALHKELFLNQLKRDYHIRSRNDALWLLGHLWYMPSGDTLSCGYSLEAPPSSQIKYLKREFYKKPLVTLTVQCGDVTISLDESLSANIREMIKNSHHEDRLIGVTTIVLHPENEQDNLECRFASTFIKPKFFDVPRSLLQSILQKSIEEQKVILLQAFKSALENPIGLEDTTPIPQGNLQDWLNAYKDMARLAMPMYNVDRMRHTLTDTEITIRIPQNRKALN